eukprot:SAG11_NODE_8482_length_1010_cov_1.087816_2_plen_53_part_00
MAALAAKIIKIEEELGHHRRQEGKSSAHGKAPSYADVRAMFDAVGAVHSIPY